LSVILSECRNRFDRLLIIEFSIKPSRDPTSESPRDPAMGRDLKLGTTEVGAY